ncbi:hypothetical protein NDU88_004313 [Pleurodeles waltl]|uniref:Uncharacterized protein n=1 Tax=Pleurodeles waltl TaxID=8319 RepID=A0AAV7W721_PLEWA|nr:hypothetical protein NDU88_004313 [Pleurodeles waltl]
MERARPGSLRRDVLTLTLVAELKYSRMVLWRWSILSRRWCSLAHRTWRMGCYVLILESVDLSGILPVRLGWGPRGWPAVRALLDWEI